MVWSKELERDPRWWLRAAAGGGTKGSFVASQLCHHLPNPEQSSRRESIELQAYDLGRAQPFPKNPVWCWTFWFWWADLSSLPDVCMHWNSWGVDPPLF